MRTLVIFILLLLLTPPLPLQAQPSPSPAPAPRPPAKVTVRAFKVEGNTLLKDADIQAALSSYVDREMSFDELRKVATLLSGLYRRKGYFLVKVVLPTQDLSDGTARFQVVEGRFANVRVEGNKHYSTPLILSWFDRVARTPAPRYDDLERAIALVNDLLDIKVSAVLQPGKNPGETDLLLKVTDSFPFSGSLDYNNFGNRFVGTNRVGLFTNFGNLAGLGDLLSLRFVTAFPAVSLRPFMQVNYGLPIDRDGGRLSVSYANGATAVGAEVTFLDIQSQADVYSLIYYKDLQRSQAANSHFSTGFVGKSFTNSILDIPRSDDQIREIFLEYGGDVVAGGGKTVYSVSVTQGLGTWFGGSPLGHPLASRPDASNDFTKLNLDLVRLQPIGRGFVILRASGQAAFDPLLAGEQYSVGGPDSVRGYQQSEVLGDTAFLASAELRIPVVESQGTSVQAAIFVDHGTAWIKNAPPGTLGTQSLTGTGVGMRGLFGTTSVRLDIGFPIDPDVNAQNRSPMIYGQATYSF